VSPSDGREAWVAAAQKESEELDLGGLEAVVNAAGNADPVSSDDAAFLWPNTVLPLCLLRACARAGVPRFVHVSSAAVQGRLRLDDSERHQPLSAYARSKAVGEDLLLAEAPGPTRLVIYRPVGVQVASRPTTRSLVRLASSRLSVVARTPDGPSPQLTVDSMCTAIGFLLEHADPPVLVAHTGDGLSPYELSWLLGGRRPLLPNAVARTAVRAAGLRHAGWGRRAEVLLLGQRVGPTWLGRELRPTADAEDAWRRLGREVRSG
jgi:nucleoside-diphosphate-sugar epimerase